MPESPESPYKRQIPLLPAFTLSQIERTQGNNRLIERRSSPPPHMSVEEIRAITASFCMPNQPETSDYLSAYQFDYPFPPLEPDDCLSLTTDLPHDAATNPKWLTPQHTIISYKNAPVTAPPADTIRQYVLDSIRSHDAVFVVSLRKNAVVPISWIPALEELKLKIFPDIDFDFMFIPNGSNETVGGIYVDAYHLVIDLHHDNSMCIKGDDLMAELEMCITRMVPPIYKRCRAVRKEVERVANTPPATDFIAPEPLQPPIKKPVHNGNASDRFLACWEAQARAERDAANRVRLAVVRSTSQS